MTLIFYKLTSFVYIDHLFSILSTYFLYWALIFYNGGTPELPAYAAASDICTFLLPDQPGPAPPGPASPAPPARPARPGFTGPAPAPKFYNQALIFYNQAFIFYKETFVLYKWHLFSIKQHLFFIRLHFIFYMTAVPSQHVFSIKKALIFYEMLLTIYTEIPEIGKKNRIWPSSAEILAAPWSFRCRLPTQDKVPALIC